jgi:hypothetical protein
MILTELLILCSYFIFLKCLYYRNLTEACHTKANNKNRIGIIGKTSINGSNGAYASGSRAKDV